VTTQLQLVNIIIIKRNEEILLKLKVGPVDKKMRGYKSNWPRHVTRMNRKRMPRVMLNYGPNGGRRLGRHFEETIRRGLNRSINPLNAELNPICNLLVLLGDLTFMGPCIVSIF
jgi:hypothetical protein